MAPGPEPTRDSPQQIHRNAGADALELNLYEVVTDLNVPGSAIERQLSHLSPFFAAFGNVARQLDAAGADGLVMFNRFYQRISTSRR